MEIPTRPGRIEVIFGPMFSGKSDELIRRLRKACYGTDRGKVIAFRPERDSRSQPGKIETHSGGFFEAKVVSRALMILEQAGSETTVVGIDEAQFFDPQELVQVCVELAIQGVRVIVAGLALDFMGRPFEWFQLLASQAESVQNFTAHCSRCGGEAPFSQRLDGSTDRIEVGGEELYAPRCRLHFNP